MMTVACTVDRMASNQRTGGRPLIPSSMSSRMVRDRHNAHTNGDVQRRANMAERIKAVVTEDGFEIIANRDGLLGLATICQQLAALPETAEESRPLGNHYHYAPWMNNADEDSIAFTILYQPEL
jgi:hypothetical protein